MTELLTLQWTRRFFILLMLVVCFSSCQPKRRGDDDSTLKHLLQGAVYGRFSADGRKILFTKYYRGRPHSNEIYVYNIKHDDLRRLTHNDHFDGEPTWGPNGNMIALVSEIEQQKNIFVIDLNSSLKFQLTTLGGEYPSWNPVRPLIAYAAARNGEQNIYVYNLETGFVQALTDEKSEDTSPRWSPDGNFIVFTSDRGMGKDIWILDYRNLQQIQITEDAYTENYATWSPDMKYLVYSSDKVVDSSGYSASGPVNLWIISVEDFYNIGQPELLLTSSSSFAQNLFPDWAPDNSSILFSSNEVSVDWGLFLYKLRKKKQ